MPPAAEARHGSAVAWCGRGVLILGASGAGKSSLLTGLLAAGGYLVADDLVRLVRHGHRLVATGVSPPGLIELRGGGIFRLAATNGVPVDLCVQLESPDGQDRLPERRTMTIEGVKVASLRLAAGRPQAAAVLVALAARRVD